MARLKDLIDRYGWVALGTWMALFVLTWSAVTLAIVAGVEVNGARNEAGTIAGAVGLAYGITYASKPLRLAATLALTPMVAAVLRRTPATPDVAQPAGPDAEHDAASVAEPAPSEG